MQKTTSATPSRLWVSGIVFLLLVQGILGLLVSISQLSQLLAPGRPVIVTGLNIITGPLAGIAFVVATASLLALSVGIGNGINALIGDYVQRPRPSPSLVHVDVILKYNSFPSGHTCHMMVYYGFLLFLSLIGPVRTWPYRWTLIPLQAFALLNILLMGYSRVYEGEHWLGDVMAGYLSGALWLTLFICLYHLTTLFLKRRRTRKNEDNHAREK